MGLGDDAAVLRVPTGRLLVAACDPVVVGVHAEPGTAGGLLARKAVARNLADLAAMGARPLGQLVSVLLSPHADQRFHRALTRGFAQAATRWNCPVLGGDTGRTPGPTTLTVTALGTVQPKRILRRDAVRAGDALWVTGALGGSISGRHLRFEPPLAAGEALGRCMHVGGVLDVSDGLLLDLATMLRSGSELRGRELGAVLHASSVPVTRAAKQLAKSSGRSPLHHALSDGEDHVLLFSARPHWRPARVEALAQCTKIGTVRDQPGLMLRGERGASAEGDGAEEVPLRVAGYEHSMPARKPDTATTKGAVTQRRATRR